MQNYYWEDLEYQFQTNQDKKINPMNVVFDDITDEEFIEKNLMISEEEAKIMTDLDLDKSNENTSTELTESDEPNKHVNIDKVNVSKKKSTKEDNIPEPITTYGFGKQRY